MNVQWMESAIAQASVKASYIVKTNTNIIAATEKKNLLGLLVICHKVCNQLH
ncbi:MAG TPA: hypothetical protein V6D28_02055 [Leptolyngbyaceae cyanobacterium]